MFRLLMRASLLCSLAAGPIMAESAGRDAGSDEGTPAKSAPTPPPAEDPQKVQEERLRKLEEEVNALKAALATPKAEPAQLGGAGGSAAKALNPDISLNGDFLGSVGRNDVRPVPSLEMHEVELGVQSVIDPYSRGDVFLSFGDGGVSVEEAFVTFTALPGEFVAKVGKMRAAFGKVNTTHNHALAWTDRPLVTENLVNGEDGIGDMGVSVSRILPAPGDLFLEATAQVFRGDSGDLFKASQKKDLSFVGHLRGYEDLIARVGAYHDKVVTGVRDWNGDRDLIGHALASRERAHRDKGPRQRIAANGRIIRNEDLVGPGPGRIRVTLVLDDPDDLDDLPAPGSGRSGDARDHEIRVRRQGRRHIARGGVVALGVAVEVELEQFVL